MTFGIRRAVPDEADLLTGIAFAAKRHWRYPEDWIRKWAPLLTITPEAIVRLEVWCAERGEEVVGLYALDSRRRRASLEHLWVLPPHTGKEVRRALFEHAVELARARGCEVLEIEADPHAAGLYGRMGAASAGEQAGEVDGQPRALPVFLRSL